MSRGRETTLFCALIFPQLIAWFELHERRQVLSFYSLLFLSLFWFGSVLNPNLVRFHTVDISSNTITELTYLRIF